MKTITLTQPWATLVAIGAKRIETRSWATRYRGPLAIHAAKGYGKGGMRTHKELCGTEPFCSVLNAALERWYSDRRDLRDMVEHPFMPLGAIVAVCELVDCVSTGLYSSVQHGGETWQVPPGNMSREYSFGDYSAGRFAWLLADIRSLPEPIPARGALGLWNYDEELSL
jgi:activating signal cointegrator 1